MYGQYSQQSLLSNTPRQRPPVRKHGIDTMSLHHEPSNVFSHERSANLKGREILLNIRKNVPVKPTCGSTLPIQNSQKKISEYFKESKVNTISSSSGCGPRAPKRTLKELHEKYDNFYSQPMNIPAKIPFPQFLKERENKQRNTCTQQTTSTQLNDPPLKIQKRPSTTAVEELKCTTSRNNIEKQTLAKMIHLVGSVENVLRWHEILKNNDMHVIYNVIGNFVNTTNGTYDYEKHVFVRGNSGTVLECSYFEIESKLPKMNKGQTISCFGHVTRAQKFSLYVVHILQDTGNSDIQRAIFFSDRRVLEYFNSKDLK